jgi:hypothetical protein
MIHNSLDIGFYHKIAYNVLQFLDSEIFKLYDINSNSTLKDLIDNISVITYNPPYVILYLQIVVLKTIMQRRKVQ